MVLAATTIWTATANADWLHLDGANQSGTGSMNVVFTYDANPGATRTGTLTIAGQTLTITQAGSSYVAATGPLTTLVASGLSNPAGVALDGAGNVYIASELSSTVTEWTASNNAVTTLVASGLYCPTGVAVDGAGNVYIADCKNGAIKELTRTNSTVTTLWSGEPWPTGVAVDGSGNVYFSGFFADGARDGELYYEVWEWPRTTGVLSQPVWTGLNNPNGVALDTAGNLYIADTDNNVIKKWTPPAENNVTTLGATGLSVPWGVAVDGAGNLYISDSGHSAVKKWTAANNTITTLVTSGSGNPTGVAVDGAGNVYFADAANQTLQELPRAFVDSTAKSEGWFAGSDVLPVVLPATANLRAPFAPMSDNAWLTITGITNGVVSFALSANTGSSSRNARITLLGQRISVTQAAPPVAITEQPASVITCAGSPAVFTVTAVGDNLAYQWQVSRDGGSTFTNISGTATNASYTNMAPTAVDNANQYEVVVSAEGASVTSAPPSVLTVNPPATARASATQTICAGSATAGLGGTVGGGATGGTWSSSGTGTFAPNATALSATYIPSAADITASTVTLTLNTTGQLSPCGPATAQVVVAINPAATASAGPNQAISAGASTAGLGGTVGGGATGGIWTSSGSGSFAPNATTLNATYTPSASDIAAGTVTLTLSSTGQQAPCGLATAQVVVTINPAAALGTTVLLEGPGTSNDSVVLAVNPATTTWTAAANAAWLHLSVANQSGTGSTNVVFGCDANPGATRTGTLTIAGQTLAVTQAGSTYVAAPGPVTALVASGLNLPRGVAVDGAGNVYIADYTNNAIKEWTAANNTVTTLVSSGLNGPNGVAVDGAGNVYIADTGNNAIKEWMVANNTVTTLVASGLNQPWGIAVDGAGNVYIADTLNNAIKEWTVANSNLTTLVASGLSQPRGVAVDGAGNVYIAQGSQIKEWTAANNTVTTLVSSGLLLPYGVAVDGGGNVYTADTYHSAVKEWTAANNTVTTLVASGLLRPDGVAVDSAGNVYIADGGNNAVKALPHAFVDPTLRWEGPAAGSDVLPVVLPATANLLAPFAPTSDQPWLTITGISNGAVSFAFSANTSITKRTAHITLLGQPIAITQTAAATQPAQLSVCAGSPAIFSTVTAGGGLTYQWQVSGDNGFTFTNISDTATNACYTNLAPTLADNGNAYQVIVTSGGGVITSAPPSMLTVNSPATASAGANQTICADSATAGLRGTVSGGATGGTWSSSGTGSFAPNAKALSATYSPSAADVAVGAVTLMLSTTGQLSPCGPATAQVVLTINPVATVSAGANQTICAGSSTADLGGTVGGGATGGTWSSSGTGSFSPEVTTLDATYTPSASDIIAATVTLTLSATGQLPPCVASAQVVVTINGLSAIATQPTNLTVCAGVPAIFSVGASGAGLSYQWQVSQDGGTTFTNISNTATNACYTNAAPTLADNGHQYQVIVSGTCPPPQTSSPPAVLAVNTPAAASAGGNQTICAGNSTMGLGGSTGGAATGGTWTSSGTGSFVPTATTLNAAYTPSAADITAGTVTLTLVATGQLPPCVATAQVMVTIPAPPAIRNPPANLTVAAGSPAVFSVGAAGAGLSYQWQVSQDGGATFTNISNAATNANYTNAATTLADNGNRYQVMVSGACPPPATSSPPAVLTVNPPPPPACVPPPSGLVGWWRGEGNGNDSAGTNNAYALPGVSFTNGIVGQAFAFETSGPYVGVQIADQPYYALTNSLTIEGWIRPRGDGYYILQRGDNRSGFDPYSMSMGLNNILSFGITDTNGNSESVSAPLVYNQWWYVVGTLDGDSGDLSLYTNGSLADQITTMVRPIGALIPGDSPGIGIGNVNDGYHNFPFLGDIDEISLYNRALAAAEIQAIYNAASAGKCTKPVPPVTTVPTNPTVCAGSPAIFSAATTGEGLSYQWQVSRDGGITFINISGMATNASYTNAATTLADNGNAYQVIITWWSGVITSAPPSVLTVNASATASAGSNQTICAGTATSALGGTVGGGATGGTWSSSGTGSFAPNVTALNATYIPSAGDIAAGTVTLTLSSTGQLWPCTLATAQVVVTINPAATASAGTNQTICAGSATAALYGTVSGGAIGGTWSSSGTGSFAPNTNALSATYSPSAADITAGTVTLTLSTTGQLSPCTLATAQVVVTINPTASASAGPNQTICAGSATAGLCGTVGGGAKGGIWSSSGTGSFAPNVRALSTTYTPSAADIAAGTVTLTLHSTGQLPPCGPATAQVVVTIKPLSTASAGVYQTICAGSATAGLGGTVGGGATGGAWSSSGTGSFTPNATTLNATYSPSAADITAATVTLTLSTTGQLSPCIPATAQVVVTINALAAITAQPTNATVCAGSPAIFTAVSTGVGLNYQWQVSADGGTTFTNISDTATNASYTNATTALADNGHQYQVIVSGTCPPPQTSSPPAVLAVNTPATASACANQTICADSATAPLGGTVGGSATGGTWSSSGTGSFAPNATALNATYSPSAADITAGTVTLTLCTTGQLPPCGPATAQVVLSITPVTVTPPRLTGPMGLSNGRFQFAFSNNDLGASFTVLTTTNPWLPLSNWTVAGPATNTAPGLFQFSTSTTNTPQGYYRVRSP